MDIVEDKERSYKKLVTQHVPPPPDTVISETDQPDNIRMHKLVSHRNQYFLNPAHGASFASLVNKL